VPDKREKKIELTGVQIIVLAYFLSIIVATILLLLPVFHREGVSVALIDAFFMATSAVTVTGLTSVNTAATFNIGGQFVILLFMQLGGVGIMTLGTFIWLVAGRKIGMRERELIKIDHNRSEFSGLVQLMRRVLGIVFAIELTATLIVGTYLLQYYSTWYEAYYSGLFHTISAFTNAGFDVFGDSLINFSNNYPFQLMIMLLIILGGIGFPVLIEIKEFITAKKGTRRNFRFSLFSKLATSTFAVLLIVGFVLILLFENSGTFAGMAWHEKVFYALFNSVAARSSGYVTMDVTLFSPHTLFLITILMFIGASPSSAGGGIRTTTFALVVLAIAGFVRGKRDLTIFKRRIEQEDILKSFMVFTTAILILGTSVILLQLFESENFTLMQIVYEVTSAFGTTGSSMGITSELSVASKLLISLLMFIGRIGILSLLLLFREKKSTPKVNYPTEKIIIG
jgi:potassium uptake TrkH family protein